MLKLNILVLGIIPLYATAMDHLESFNLFEWQSTPLKALILEASKPTCNEYNYQIKKLKLEFVARYLEKYRNQQEILKDLCEETKGTIRATPDPELAQNDSNKILCLNPLEYTADQIDERWQRIQHADCKYIRSKAQ